LHWRVKAFSILHVEEFRSSSRAVPLRPSMRNFLLFGLLAVIAMPAWAERPVTVAQLQQILSATQAAHKSDAAVADEIASLQLTEELTAQTLDHMTTALQVGPKSAQALDLLADSSALLAPPAAELPTAYQPDVAMQRAILDGAINFVVKVLRHLPDFLATRTTQSFDDNPFVIGHSGYAPVTNLRPVGTFSRLITYRDGHEVADSAVASASAKPQAVAGPAGLSTSGEFGPVLAIVLSDAAKGKISWTRWEMTSAGKAAVFHYEVPKAASHYYVDYCCAWDPTNDNPLTYHGTPGYRGELYVDPSTGAVLRITLEAELNGSNVISYAAISVQYGSVDIGGITYMCPVHSVAISSAFDRQGKTMGGVTPVRRINEVSFTNYHRFGSSSRILAATPGPETPAANAATPAMVPEAVVPAPAAVQPNAEEAREVEPPVPTSAAPPATATSDATTPSTSDAAPIAAPATKEAPTSRPLVFKTTTREVVVDVVATKGNGEPVIGLGKQDFAIAEDGTPQSIDFFEEHSGNTQPVSAPPEMPAMPAGVRTNAPPAPLTDAVNVLLLDSLNTEQQDQAYVHQQIMDFLKKMQPGTRVAIFTLGSKLRFIQGFTTDTSALIAAINDKRYGVKPEKISRDRSDDADDAEGIANLQAMRASAFAIETLQASQVDAGIRDYAAHVQMTFQALDYLARYLSGVPGRKNLIWFATSFPVVIFPTVKQRESIKQNPNLPGYLDQVKTIADLFTAGKIAIYPIGASGVMTEHIAEANVISPVPSPAGVGHIGNLAPDANMAPYSAGMGGRADAVSAMEQLAASTGGKAYYNTNDLNAAMVHAINDGAQYYTLGYSPTNTRMDGSYRQIDVKLAEAKYRLAYRRGYNADDSAVNDAKSGISPLSSLLQLGMPGATGVLYGVSAAPAASQPATDASPAGQNPNIKGPLTRYKVDFIIRAQDIAMDPDTKGRRSGKILIGLKAYDRDGNALNWEGNIETLDLSAQEYGSILKTGVPVHMEIDLPANTDIHLLTGVYDWNNGKAGTLEIPIHR